MFGTLFRRKPTQPTTRIFFASDLHGSQRTFRKFLGASKHYGADILILGGDVIGKVAIPIIETSAGRYRVHLMGRTEQIEGADGLAALLDRLGTLGFYGKVMSEDEFAFIQADPSRVEALFHELAYARLAEWIGLAEERLRPLGMRCYMMGGNDDDQVMIDRLRGLASDTVIYSEDVLLDIDDHHQMIASGYSSPTPWNTPRELPEDALEAHLSTLVDKVPDPRRTIFNFHVPPVDSTLDTCPMLDWTSDPPRQIVKNGQAVMHGAGSHAVRHVIERAQPMLSLHGHIHESGGTTRIGATVAVNPGSEYGEGVLRGCLMTLQQGEVKSLQMTSG